ncbi:hypothetical protein ACS127_10410 [Amphibacillus sp. Q70]|uniref:hypothetical protein n=1 Tax=Amphibacillus sp. Q70 TaxID=3453416 RepID=UPI003F87C79E
MSIEIRVNMKDGEIFHFPNDLDQTHDEILNGILHAKRKNGTVTLYDSYQEITRNIDDVRSLEYVFL